MRLQMAQYVMWFSAPALQVATLAFMRRRKLHRDYPLFFNYTVLQVLTSAFGAPVSLAH